MNIALYQIIVPIVALIMIMRAFSRFFRGNKTLRELLGWIVFWGCIAVVALFPTLTEYLAGVLGIKSNVNAIVFTLLGVLSYLCFKLVVAAEENERALTRLTRELAKKEYRVLSNSTKNN